MMNKSPIDWCDFTWNPITGCLHTCEYCYARKLARRFCGDVRLNKSSGQIKQWLPDDPKDMKGNILYVLPEPFKAEGKTPLQFPTGFSPTLHEYRLPMPAQKKKPANIFVCSMADLFGAWVPDEWIRRVFEACEAAPWHNYLFLTKNPQRLIDMGAKGQLPAKENYWYGTTITDDATPFFYSEAHNCFLSIEPLMGAFGKDGKLPPAIKWVIIGAETGNRRGKTTPEREWIENIISAASATGAAVLIKDSKEMRAVWDDDLIQQFPQTLTHGKEDGK